MQILLLTQVLPYPPDSGPKVKTFNVIKYLAKYHEVTLISFVRDDQSADVEALKPFCRSIYTLQIKRSFLVEVMSMLKSIVTNQPWMILRDEREEMHSLVKKVATTIPFDVIHADQLNMAQYAERVLGGKKVLDAHNALWLLYKRLAETMGPGLKRLLLERDWRLLKKYEGRICDSFDSILAVSGEDKEALQEICTTTPRIIVVPIAVDTHQVQPIVRNAGANHILHIGTMYWPPNIDGIKWFLSEVYPIIRDRNPEVLVDIVGARPPQYLLDLNRKNQGVNVTGYVKDPKPYLQKAGVFIVPLRAGGGMRVKILEALAQSLPVVSTTIGAEGISVIHGKHILIADNPNEFARHVMSILNDRSLADQLGMAGRQLIEEKYNYLHACQTISLAYEG